MLQYYAQFLILLINAHFVADNASHALVSSSTVRPTFNVEKEVVFIRNGWTPKEEEEEVFAVIFVVLVMISAVWDFDSLYEQESRMRYITFTMNCCSDIFTTILFSFRQFYITLL